VRGRGPPAAVGRPLPVLPRRLQETPEQWGVDVVDHRKERKESAAREKIRIAISTNGLNTCIENTSKNSKVFPKIGGINK